MVINKKLETQLEAVTTVLLDSSNLTTMEPERLRVLSEMQSMLLITTHRLTPKECNC